MIMNRLGSLVLAGALASLLPVPALAYDGKAPAAAAAEKPKNVLEAARENGGFTIFLAAVEEADMTAALSSPRLQYTLYAPTDAAFAKLPKEKLAALLEDKDELRRVIAQHVVLGRYHSSDIGAGVKRTIWGEPLAVTTHRNLHVNWVKVVATDLDSGNGIVHATDNVILSTGDADTGFARQMAQFNAASLGQGNRF
jgi:uncharacterized surface protein with fasciclin (FAS1) repeats